MHPPKISTCALAIATFIFLMSACGHAAAKAPDAPAVKSDPVKARCSNEFDSVLAEAKAASAKGDPRTAFRLLYPCKDSPGGVANRDFIAQMLAAVEAVDKKRIEGEKIEADKVENARMAEQQRLQSAYKAHLRTQGVAVGMTRQQALDSSWGAPDHINTTTTASGVNEQWVYTTRNALYFVNGKLTVIQN